MAVFTEVSEDDRQSITDAYGFTALSSVIGIADGDTDTTYLFRAQEGEFKVTLFEIGAQPPDLERAFETMEALTEKGVPCPSRCARSKAVPRVELQADWLPPSALYRAPLPPSKAKQNAEVWAEGWLKRTLVLNGRQGPFRLFFRPGPFTACWSRRMSFSLETT